MQARKVLSLLIMPAVLLPGLAARAVADELRSIGASTTEQAATSTGAAAPADSNEKGAPVAATDATPAAASAVADSFGVAMSPEQLDSHRGGDALIGQNYLTGTVSDNVANRIATGSNAIAEGSFANSSGLPTVIQNTGANVLIQNATVLNVRFGN